MSKEPAQHPHGYSRPLQYAAVIRAYEHTPLLEEVVVNLRRQTAPPQSIIIVDSSQDPNTRRHFGGLADLVVQYTDSEFNFSKAVNIGVAAHNLPLTLIVSSHVVFRQETLVYESWVEASKQGCEIVFWVSDEKNDCLISRIEIGNFTGRNGISNSSTLIPSHLIKERPFREEVFAAEDQEFTRYYLRRFRRPILRIDTKAIEYLNPNHGGTGWNETKLINEELAIGHFVNRRLIMPDRILARFLRGILAIIRNRPNRARVHFGVAKAFLLANFKPPKRKSRYF